ncbi:hypothetical protein [Arthrobacter bambusae]|uniref:hypothetical protein n=1 Tax=Arthrobacter bambusae TaxID=1338426 RepID=UPI0027868587|nr:hypothetical protein [Arthrobacter bambusae]MDQ0029686.1 hypothetical protein [Arthrobacter bambusae]MDQ0097347.1 hypothetical protein [Arthrobacter bambusae]
MVISEAHLARRSKGLIWGIVGASVVVVVVSAMVSGIVLPGLVLAAGIVALTWAIVRATVSVAITGEKIVLRCAPFYSTEVPISDVLAVTTAEDTTLSDGYGFQVMGKNTRGLLVGGPAVAFETNNRRWIVSTAHPEEVASTIQDQIETKRISRDPVKQEP